MALLWKLFVGFLIGFFSNDGCGGGVSFGALDGGD